MGILIRKSFITSIFSYLGVVIGYLNILYFFPKFLSPAQIGFYRLILDTAILLSPFAQSGLMQGIIRFLPVYHRQEKTKDFVLFSFFFFLLSAFFFSAALLLLKEEILQFLFSENARQVKEFFNLLIYLVIVLSLIALFEGFERANLQIVLVNFLKDVYIRLLTAVSIFLYFQQTLSSDGLLYSLLVIYGSSALILLIKHFSKPGFTPGFSLNIQLKDLLEVVRYNFFMVVSAGSNLIVSKIDSLMISAFLGFSENGIYTTLFYVAVVIEIPKRAISQVALSLYSKAFANNKINEIQILYQKTSLNQLIIGLLLYVGILVNLHNLFTFIPNGEVYETGKWVVVIIGFSRIIDMAAGSNTELIVMSRHYKFNVIAVASLAILTILTNILLLPVLGINGAAIASFISLLCFNLVKFIFIFRKFGFQPFSKQTLMVLAIGLFCFVIGISTPQFTNNYLDVIIRSVLVLLVYSSLIFYTAVSEDINTFLKQNFKNLKNKK